MKIQIDSEAKTIKVGEAVNFGELLSILENAFPDFKEYKIIPMVWQVQNPVPDPNSLWPPKVLYLDDPQRFKPSIDPSFPFKITCTTN